MFGRIPNKRAFLAGAFEQLGVLKLLERTIARGRPGLIVLTYHRIAEPGTDQYYDPVISATPESFRDQVNWLGNRVRLLTLDELVVQVESRSAWREPMALITFDDGYRDNFDLAAPILRERGIPATFFLPTAFLDSPRLPWWDHVACVIKQTEVGRLVVDRDPARSTPPLEIDLRASSRTAAIRTIIRAFLDNTIPDERWFLDQLTERARVELDAEELGRGLFMTWDQAKQLADSGAGMAIGSHSQSHPRLASLNEDAQYQELASSKQILENRIGRPIKALAYPYGWPGSYTAATMALAARAGYRVAFSSHEGINRFAGLDRYAMSRIGVGSADSAALLRARSVFHCAFGNSIL